MVASWEGFGVGADDTPIPGAGWGARLASRRPGPAYCRGCHRTRRSEKSSARSSGSAPRSSASPASATAASAPPNRLPIWITSLRDPRHLEVNEAAIRHGGYSREEMLGKSKMELWVTDEQRERMLRLLHQEGRVRDFEVAFRTRAGEERRLLVNSEVITFGGEPAVLSVSIDITERSQHEAHVRERRDEAETLARSLREETRAKDEFLAMLGHELRNPLGTLSNAVAVLGRLDGDETMRHVVAIIGRQTGHLARLGGDLLDGARATSGNVGRPRPTA